MSAPDANGERPHLRRVGAYGFFAICAFSLGVLVTVLLKMIGFNHDARSLASGIVTVASFLALRDMTTLPKPPVA